MSYQQMMDQKFPAKLSIRDDVNSDRPDFDLAHRPQVTKEWHSHPSVISQVQAFVDAKRRQHVNTPPSASNSVYRPLTPSTEIRVFELLSAMTNRFGATFTMCWSISVPIMKEGRRTSRFLCQRQRWCFTLRPATL